MSLCRPDSYRRSLRSAPKQPNHLTASEHYILHEVRFLQDLGEAAPGLVDLSEGEMAWDNRCREALHAFRTQR
jgi:hypothetical protein